MAADVLQHTIREAAYAFIHTNGKLSREKLTMMETSKQALAFLMGTGLEVMLMSYNLAYDADSIREAFLAKFHIKQT